MVSERRKTKRRREVKGQFALGCLWVLSHHLSPFSPAAHSDALDSLKKFPLGLDRRRNDDFRLL
jgi:hypothetical protein